MNIREKGKGIADIVQKTCVVLCAIIFLFYVWLFIIWQHGKHTVIGTVGLLGIVLLLVLCSKIPCLKNIKVPKITPLCLFASCFLTRLVYCLNMDFYVIQKSDFELTLREAISGQFTDEFVYYKKFMHKMFYPQLMHLLGVKSQAQLFVVQCVIVSVIPVFLYAIGKLIVNEKVGLLSGGLYIIWPFQLFYTTVATEEHLSALITVLVVYFIIKVITDIEKKDSEVTIKEIVLLGLTFVLIGVLCGLSNLFKDWAAIIVVAAVIYFLVFIVRTNWKQRLIFFAGILILLIARSLTLSAFEKIAEKTMGEPVNNVGGAIICQMWESLNPNGTGTYDEEAAEEYFDIVQQYDYDFEAVNQILLQDTITNIKTNINKMPSFLIKKGRHAYGDEKQGTYIALEDEIKDEYQDAFSKSTNNIIYIATLYYFMIVVGMVVSCATLKNDKLFLILLIVLGAMTAGLLVESQGRYKYGIEPIWCILAANAIYTIKIKIRKK